jgi:hypothetical protein
MIKAIVKILLLSSSGIILLATMPSLFIPLSDAIDTVIDSNLTNVLSNVYSSLGSEILSLIRIQISTLIIVIILSWVIGSKK